MKKNIKSIFLLTLLVLLLVGITSVNATDDLSVNNTDDTVTQIDTTPHSTVQDSIINDNRDIQKTNTKSVKTDGNDNIDYYVSDNDGQDTNTGTQESPFKTIQTAIDKTTADKTYNIYIAEGTYKGLKNTNLTVNGNYNINFIGDGINKTVIDGEASFEIQYPVDGDPYYWGSSEDWYYYINAKGNYFMTINKGTGKIQLNNFTVYNMFTVGGSRISAYKHTTVDNYANLEINNMNFIQNYGGVGSAIRNNNGATLTVNNSYFENNTKSSSTGNMGIIYNNGTSTILNSIFNHNHARWGTLLNDANMTVINTSISNNIGYDGASTYKYGAGIAANSGDADFFNEYYLLTYTNISQCNFYNNSGADICVFSGNINITNNKFNNSTGIYIKDNVKDKTHEYNIKNNIFNNMIESDILSSLSSGNSIFAIYAKQTNSQVTIQDNEFTSEKGTMLYLNNSIVKNNKIDYIPEENSILLYDNNIVENNMLTNPIIVSGSNNNIKYNYINTDNESTIYIQTIKSNNKVTDNKLSANTLNGDESVSVMDTSNTVENNVPDDRIYCSPDVTTAEEGTRFNPTTITDALSKVQNNQTIYLLKGSMGEYILSSTIIISETTIGSDVTTFTITGDNVALNGNLTVKILDIQKPINLTIENISFINAKRSNQKQTGAAINNKGNLTLRNVNFYNNTLLGKNSNGGAIYSAGLLIVQDCNFVNNNAKQDGGAIFSNGTLIINGTNNFINCNATSYGGAINTYMTNINNSLFINGTNNFINNTAKSMGGAINQLNGILTIEGNNNFINNKIVGERQLQGGALYSTANTTINGTNLFENNSVTGINALMGGAISIRNNTLLISGENKFINNKAEDQSNAGTGGTIYSTLSTVTITGKNTFQNGQASNGGIIYAGGSELNIIGENTFTNSSAINGAIIYTITKITNITGNNTFSNSTTTQGIIYVSGSGNELNIYNFTINGATIENVEGEQGVAIYIRGVVTNINITNNTFQNIKSENETIIIQNITNIVISDNQYNNCSIGTYCTLTSIMEGQEIPPLTPIPLNITTELLYPEFYDSNIFNNLFYEIYVNNENKINTTEKNILITEGYRTETEGLLTIYAFIPDLNKQTNSILINISKPLDTTIEITTPKENTINKTTPITIILSDEKGNLVKDAQIKVYSSSVDETVTLPNGVLVYQYTPTSVGEETITFTYDGNNRFKPTETNLTLTVIQDKDKIIEELNNTIQEQNSTIGNLTNTVEEQASTITSLNDTVNDLNSTIQEQNSIIGNLTNTIEEQASTISSLNDTVNDLNSTVQEQSATIENLTNTVEEQVGTITSLNDTVNDLNSTVEEQSTIINNLNNTVQEQSSTIENLNNTIQEQNSTIENLTNTVQEQSNTISSLNDTVNDLNSTVQEQTGTIENLNNTVQEQTGTIENLNNTVQEQADTINSLNDTVNDLNSTVQEQASTISDLNNTIQTQNSTIEDLQEQIDELKAPKNTTIIFDEITDARYNGNVTISGSLVNDESIGLFNQVVTLTIGDEEVNVTTKGGVFEYTTVFKELGEKTVTANYAGSDKYLASNATTTFNVEKQDVIVTVDEISDIAYGENVSITGKFTDADGNKISNSNVKILINGKKYYARTDSNGVYVLSVKITSVGVNNVTVGYSGNTNYNSYETDTTFNVVKQDVVVTFETIQDTIKGDNVTITGTFKDANGNAIGNSNVKILINGKKYYARTDSNGVYVLSVQVTAVGVNNVSIGYSGNDNYNSYETNTTFNVDKQNVIVTCDPIADVDEGDNVTIKGTFKDSNGKAIANSNVKIIVNGKKYYARTDSNGAYEFTTTANVVGVNNVSVGYSGNANYNSYETTTTFNVIAKND